MEGTVGGRESASVSTPLRDTWLTMSQEDVQLVRESFLATGSGDPAAAQATRERFFDRSIEWDMSGVVGWTEKQVYRGQEVERGVIAARRLRDNAPTCRRRTSTWSGGSLSRSRRGISPYLPR